MVGQVVDIAEHATYLELTSRICYYDEPNLNDVLLPYDDATLERAQTLINMPVQAKYRVNANGDPTFGSHEMHKKKDGTVSFGTSSIGTHVEVWIENDNVDVNGVIKNLPCLFAKYRLWRRYPNMIAAAQRLYSEGKLYSSWEINTYQYIFEQGIRKVTDYEFLSNCLLGYEYAYPSYGTSANAIDMAQLNDNQLMIAEALSQDLFDDNNTENVDKEDELLSKKNETVVAEKETAKVDNSTTTETNTDAPTADVAQLTSWDLRCKINEACRNKMGKWCWVSYFFPNEKEVWCEYDGRDTELDYAKFTYEVGENDSITVSEPEYVKLAVSVAEINTKVAELEKAVETTKAELDIKNNAITKASETIQDLNTQIAELTPYKEQVEVAEQKKIEAQIAAEKQALKDKLAKGDLFTAEEIASADIQKLIDARDTAAINSLIADRFVASIDKDETPETTETTSEKTPDVATASLEVDEVDTDIRSFMGKILSN